MLGVATLPTAEPKLRSWCFCFASYKADTLTWACLYVSHRTQQNRNLPELDVVVSVSRMVFKLFLKSVVVDLIPKSIGNFS